MSAKITLLGTGTCQLQKERFASSALIEIGDLKLVFDFGRGIAQRLTELNLTQDDLRNIYISHFHPDHISDLIPYLHAARHSRIDPRKLDLHIYGPSGLKVMLMRLLSMFGNEDLLSQTYDIQIHEMNAGKFEINRQVFEMVSLPPAGNHGLKFEVNSKICVITGDAEYNQNLVDFLKGVDFAIIDAGHLTEDAILNLAVHSQAKNLVCSHLYRDMDGGLLSNAALSRGYRGKLVIAADLMNFSL